MVGFILALLVAASVSFFSEALCIFNGIDIGINYSVMV